MALEEAASEDTRHAEGAGKTEKHDGRTEKAREKVAMAATDQEKADAEDETETRAFPQMKSHRRRRMCHGSTQSLPEGSRARRNRSSKTTTTPQSLQLCP